MGKKPFIYNNRSPSWWKPADCENVLISHTFSGWRGQLAETCLIGSVKYLSGNAQNYGRPHLGKAARTGRRPLLLTSLRGPACPNPNPNPKLLPLPTDESLPRLPTQARHFLAPKGEGMSSRRPHAGDWGLFAGRPSCPFASRNAVPAPLGGELGIRPPELATKGGVEKIRGPGLERGFPSQATWGPGRPASTRPQWPSTAATLLPCLGDPFLGSRCSGRGCPPTHRRPGAGSTPCC